MRTKHEITQKISELTRHHRRLTEQLLSASSPATWQQAAIEALKLEVQIQVLRWVLEEIPLSVDDEL